jgi:hypothetical protein
LEGVTWRGNRPNRVRLAGVEKGKTYGVSTSLQRALARGVNTDKASMLWTQPWAARVLLGAVRKRVNHPVPANMSRPLGVYFRSAAITLRNSQPAYNAVCEPSVPQAPLSRMQRALASVKPKMIFYFEKSRILIFFLLFYGKLILVSEIKRKLLGIPTRSKQAVQHREGFRSERRKAVYCRPSSSRLLMASACYCSSLLSP